MGTERHEWNLGQMVRNTFGQESTFIIGFGTYNGTVTAATAWGQPSQTFALSDAEEGSYCDVMHRALPAIGARLSSEPVHDSSRLLGFYLLLRCHEGAGLVDSRETGAADEAQRTVRSVLDDPRRQRAIGVVYKKAEQTIAHYVKARLAQQFDAWIHIDQTAALACLP